MVAVPYPIEKAAKIVARRRKLAYLVVILLKVSLGKEVPVQLQVHDHVPVSKAEGHRQVGQVRVATATLRTVTVLCQRVGQLALGTSVI